MVRDHVPPVLFAAAMSLLDTIDGPFVNFVYDLNIVGMFVMTWAAALSVWRFAASRSGGPQPARLSLRGEEAARRR
jgi:high-affinity nickel permease